MELIPANQYKLEYCNNNQRVMAARFGYHYQNLFRILKNADDWAVLIDGHTHRMVHIKRAVELSEGGEWISVSTASTEAI